MVFVTTPKFGLVKVPLGGPNCGWLKRLKNSVRNSRYALSVTLVLLKTAKSKLVMPCCRSDGSTRASLPKPQSGGATKQLVLNQPLSLDTGLPEASLLQPGTTFGLRFPFVSPSAVSE